MNTSNELLLKKAENLNIMFGTFPMIYGTKVILPADYDDYLTDEEQNRLIKILENKLKNNK